MLFWLCSWQSMHENAWRLPGLLWQSKQASPLWLPLVIGNWWFQLPSPQTVVLWHCSHSWLRPNYACGGSVAVW